MTTLRWLHLTDILAVPGNHDLARPDAADPVAEQLLGEKSTCRDALWGGKKRSTAKSSATASSRGP